MQGLTSIGRILGIVGLTTALLILGACGEDQTAATADPRATAREAAADEIATKEAAKVIGSKAGAVARKAVESVGESLKKAGEVTKEAALEAKVKATEAIEKAGEVTKEAADTVSKSARETIGVAGEKVKEATQR